MLQRWSFVCVGSLKPNVPNHTATARQQTKRGRDGLSDPRGIPKCRLTYRELASMAEKYNNKTHGCGDRELIVAAPELNRK